MAARRPVDRVHQRLTVGTLAQQICPSTALDACFPDLSNTALKPADLTRLATVELQAGLGGAPVSSRRRLVLLSGSIASHGAEFVRMAESLASRGFVVAEVVSAAPSERRGVTPATAAAATSRLADALQLLATDPTIDASTTAIAAWSFGGVPAFQLAMSDPRISAMVSLDSALSYRYGVDLLRTASLPARTTALRMLAFSAGVSSAVARDDTWLASQPAVRLERATAIGLAHAGFNDLYGAWPAEVNRAASSAFLNDHAQVVAAVVRFLGGSM